MGTIFRRLHFSLTFKKGRILKSETLQLFDNVNDDNHKIKT